MCTIKADPDQKPVSDRGLHLFAIHLVVLDASVGICVKIICSNIPWESKGVTMFQYLTHKAPITTKADDIFVFRENKF